MEHRTDFRNAPTMFVRMHKVILERAREMSRERSGGLPGMIEIAGRAKGSHDGLACVPRGGVLREPLLEGANSAPTSDIFCAKRSKIPRHARRARRFVAVVFSLWGVVSKERPAVDAWNFSIFGPTHLF